MENDVNGGEGTFKPKCVQMTDKTETVFIPIFIKLVTFQHAFWGYTRNVKIVKTVPEAIFKR